MEAAGKNTCTCSTAGAEVSFCPGTIFTPATFSVLLFYTKTVKDILLPEAFLKLKIHQNAFAVGHYYELARLLVGCGRETPIPFPPLFDAFGVLVLIVFGELSPQLWGFDTLSRY